MVSINTIIISVLIGFVIVNFFTFPFDVSKCAVSLMQKHGNDDTKKKAVVLTVLVYQYFKLLLIVGAVCWAEYLICAKHFMSGE